MAISLDSYIQGIICAPTWMERYRAFMRLKNAAGERIQITLNILQTNGALGVDILEIPREFLEHGYFLLVDFLANLVANRGEILGTQRVQFQLSQGEAATGLETLIGDVQSRFERFYVPARLHANYGGTIQWEILTDSHIDYHSKYQKSEISFQVPLDKGVRVGWGMDVGGTNVKIALLYQWKASLKTHRTLGKFKFERIPISIANGSMVQTIQDALSRLLEWFDTTGQPMKSPLVLAVPGVLTPDGNIVDMSSMERRFPGILEYLDQLKGSQIPVRFINDANAATIFQYAVHPTSDTLIVNTLGTGVGLGIVQEGHLLEAPLELHFRFDYSDEAWESTCGLKGCFQNYVAAGTLVEQIIQLKENGNARFPEDLEEKIQRCQIGELRELLGDFCQLLYSGHERQKDIIKRALTQYGGVLMHGYAEIARLLQVSKLQIALVGGVVYQEASRRVIHHGIKLMKEQLCPHIQLDMHQPLAKQLTKTDAACGVPPQEVHQYWYGAAGAALLSIHLN